MTTRKPIVQVLANLDIGAGTPAEAANAAMLSSLTWLRDKQRIKVPEAAFQGKAFEIGADEGQPASVETVGNYWACQYDKLDPETPGRIWRTELSIAHSEGEAVAGVRLTVLDTAATTRPPVSVPRVVGGLAVAPGLLDADVRLGPEPIAADSAEAIDALVRLLLSRYRMAPVVVFAAGDGANAPTEAKSAAASLAGLAHVYFLPQGCAGLLKEALGREFAVWNGAIRTYYPGFDPQTDEAMTHPVATRPWLQRRFPNIQAFLQVLLAAFASRSVGSDPQADIIPSFRSVKDASLKRQMQQLSAQAKTTKVQAPLLEKKIELLNEQLAEKDKRIEELQQEFNYADEEEKKATKSREVYRAHVSVLRARIDALEVKLKTSEEEVEIPTSFEGIAAWVQEHFPERLELKTRAGRAAQKSGFQNPALVYRCLARLARDYVDCRRIGKPLDKLFDDLGVRLERTGSASELSQWSDLYWVKNGRGENTFLEWHIKQGSDKKDETTLRIYFYYDEEDERVVVGHLPTHLPNAKS